jgi:hypothetical protein
VPPHPGISRSDRRDAAGQPPALSETGMTTFIVVCLYFFAGCAVLGLLPAALLAARARQPAMIVTSLFVAAFVIFVLVAAARKVPGH